MDKSVFSFLEAYGVDDAFALCVFQTGDDGVPVGGINHQGSLCNCWVIGYPARESFHFPGAVEHGIVHVDVNYACSVFYLSGCYLQGLVIVSFSYQSGKFS